MRCKKTRKIAQKANFFVRGKCAKQRKAQKFCAAKKRAKQRKTAQNVRFSQSAKQRKMRKISNSQRKTAQNRPILVAQKQRKTEQKKGKGTSLVEVVVVGAAYCSRKKFRTLKLVAENGVNGSDK